MKKDTLNGEQRGIDIGVAYLIGYWASILAGITCDACLIVVTIFGVSSLLIWRKIRYGLDRQEDQSQRQRNRCSYVDRSTYNHNHIPRTDSSEE